jgi:hypothetical protein
MRRAFSDVVMLLCLTLCVLGSLTLLGCGDIESEPTGVNAAEEVPDEAWTATEQAIR